MKVIDIWDIPPLGENRLKWEIGREGVVIKRNEKNDVLSLCLVEQ